GDIVLPSGDDVRPRRNHGSAGLAGIGPGRDALRIRVLLHLVFARQGGREERVLPGDQPVRRVSGDLVGAVIHGAYPDGSGEFVDVRIVRLRAGELGRALDDAVPEGAVAVAGARVDLPAQGVGEI